MSKTMDRIRCLFGRHTWDGCICQVCGKTRHKWKHVVDIGAITAPVANFMDEAGYYRQRCTRCGQWKR
ncbi:MAG: hypothetical protein JXM73_22495 [Anaerolineae bacterium]|nr:hypothetical protein [Anaerolineae bacterium]